MRSTPFSSTKLEITGIFHCEIVVDNERVAAETKAYKKIPVINDFKDENGNDIMREQIERNYNQVKRDVLNIIENEKERIRKDPDLCHLLGEKNEEEEEG
ncbi:hypothetical protein FACS1894179_06140 [Bacteroidia bacterium]|nr:hypothetical protein FACS1894179_06140 [Bacteroidia bacterium]